MNLALFGGKKVTYVHFPKQETIGATEKFKLDSFLNMFSEPALSGFRGNFTQNFWGGENIKALEKEFVEVLEKDVHLEHKALTINSCTSAIIVACMAIGLKPGDEVIVTPWSMSCSATAPMFCGAIPVFADISKDDFILDPEDIKNKITDKTKAIIVVDLFGQPFKKEINEIAKKNNLYIIEDAAQAIGSYRDGIPAGFLGDIGCFSFTQGKHLTAGEGGMIVTENEYLYMKCAMIRNHAEAVCNDMSYELQEKYNNLIGMNLRMTEIQAVILREQIKKIHSFVKIRNENVEWLNKKLSEFNFITPAKINKNNTHAYYVMPFFYDAQKCEGIPRDVFIKAVKAELTEETGRIDRGVPINSGYIKPLYKFPVFKNKDMYKNVSLKNCEELQNEELCITLYHNLELKEKDFKNIYLAFKKVYENRYEILEIYKF